MKDDHATLLLGRRMFKGKLRYEVKCSCGRRTAVGSRAQVEQDQKQHKRAARRGES